MTDWRLSQLHASCPRPYPPSAALPLPLQPSFDRKQEASRLVSVLSCVRLMTPTALCWQPRNRKKYPTTQKRRFLAVLLHPLFEPCSSPLPCLVSHWQQDSYAVTIEMWCGRLEQQLYILRRGDWGTLLWLTCLSAAVWASVLPLWHVSLSSQQRANTKPLRAAKM